MKFREAADIHANPSSCMAAVCNAYISAFISASFYNAIYASICHGPEGKKRLLHTTQ